MTSEPPTTVTTAFATRDTAHRAHPAGGGHDQRNPGQEERGDAVQTEHDEHRWAVRGQVGAGRGRKTRRVANSPEQVHGGEDGAPRRRADCREAPRDNSGIH